MKVSIILVTWCEDDERLELLKTTLKSLETSTEIPYELIVVDNGLKKQTEFLKTQKIDKHIINEQNKGIGFGRNQGVKVAEGDYVAFIDNDLIFAKDWLKEGIEALETYPDKKLIASTCYSVAQSDTSYAVRRNYRGVCDEYLLWSRGCPAGAIFRKNTLKELGKWSVHPKAGSSYCNMAVNKKYHFIALPFYKIAHRGLVSSYSFKKLMKGGKWKQEWNL